MRKAADVQTLIFYYKLLEKPGHSGMEEARLETLARALATHMPPSPVLYVKLSWANKTFRRIFTSNDLWAQLNPYRPSARPESYFQTFLSSCTIEQLKSIRQLWPDPNPSLASSCSDLIVRLGKIDIVCLPMKLAYLVGTRTAANRSVTIGENQGELLNRVLELHPCSYRFIREDAAKLLGDRAAALRAVRGEKCNLFFVAEKFREDKEIVIAALRAPCHWGCMGHMHKMKGTVNQSLLNSVVDDSLKIDPDVLAAAAE